MSEPVLVLEFRGDILENEHHGVICGVNEKKEVIFQQGDIEHATFYRSAMKPIQAIPVFKTNVIEKYGLTSEEAALFAASQRGESYHQEALQSLLDKLNLSESQLICEASYPLNDQPKFEHLWNQGGKRKIFHNCFGKHLGLMAAARESGWELGHYYEPEHPLQQEILDYVAEFTEVNKEDIGRGTDGCGVPVYAVPLYNMALSYLKFVCPEMIPDERTRSAVQKIGQVMNENPRIIASHHFICTALLEDPNIIAKGGAQGVYCFALRKEKLSFALKVLTGSELVWPILIAGILEEIDYENKATIERLYELRPRELTNDNGKTVGYTLVNL
ncbi:L-asparaginase II [Pullulanibacillus pueri]|uniref:Asparaginase n=1 Tax=Pullulanibacillus pueri TaxID=1437324 RepID=A0A8J3ELR8_9BACL|nr:asparaginase [Pullulanibacillus pueri]MBM7682045.1 L-asparaginase II [Pullulanibacillus pueri]GGH80189.1 asparaginase [Pullulanibacillus pueri]